MRSETRSESWGSTPRSSPSDPGGGIVEAGAAPCDLSIIVVSYNTRELTLECLRSVERSCAGRLRYELLVVDNASSDGSAEVIRAQPGVELIVPGENLGFARANNLAAERARGRHILLLNSDTVALDGAIPALLEFARGNPQYAAYGGRTLAADGSLNPESVWGRPTPWSAFCLASGLASIFRQSRIFNPETLGAWRRDDLRTVDIVSGCFLLISAERWRELGGFDPSFFMYGEDYDLCLRARAKGARCILVPQAQIVHHGGSSDRMRADKLVKLFRARAQLQRKHWSRFWSAFGTLTLDFWAGSRAAAFGLLRLASPRAAAGREVWRQVWRRRREWRESR